MKFVKTVLKNTDFNRKFISQTDASQIGMGAVLQQEFENVRHPVMFISKTFSGAECNYTVIEKECFAIVWAVKMLRVYLEGYCKFRSCTLTVVVQDENE